jgi:hypothetical protein
MGDQKGVLLYTGDALTAGANGATKALKIAAGAPRHANCHVYIEADAAVTAATTVTIQGRVNSSSAWVTAKKQDDSTSSLTSQASGVLVDSSFPIQLFPEMRAVIAGTFAATVGTDVRVWVQADQSATRANS